MRIFQLLLSFLLLICFSSYADSWSFKKERKETEFVFGDTKIIKVVDTTNNSQYPDFQVLIYYKGELEAKYRGISFEFIYADKDNSTFVGLSNSGLPGNAVVVFGAQGHLDNVLYHERFVPEYCMRSVTVSKVWVDETDPKVEFSYAKIGEDYEYIDEITFIDCNEKRVSLQHSYIKGIESKVKEFKKHQKEYGEK
jgi:hypothetical protein